MRIEEGARRYARALHDGCAEGALRVEDDGGPLASRPPSDSIAGRVVVKGLQERVEHGRKDEVLSRQVEEKLKPCLMLIAQSGEDGLAVGLELLYAERVRGLEDALGLDGDDADGLDTDPVVEDPNAAALMRASAGWLLARAPWGAAVARLEAPFWHLKWGPRRHRT